MERKKENPKLFSIIVLSYNQFNYIRNAIDSVLMQTYPKIELIIADDASKEIHKDTAVPFGTIESVKNYINQNKGANIVDVKFIINKRNAGTVKTLNRAVKAAAGEYFLTFAADDALHEKNVISRFQEELCLLDDNQYMVSAQALMMDINLDKTLYYAVDIGKTTAMNDMTALEQYKELAHSCLYAMGASAFKMSVFNKFGFFDNRIMLIEDWSYLLHMTFSGGRIKFVDFHALKHRDGGVSHSCYDSGEQAPPHVLKYHKDMIKIFQLYVFKHKEHFNKEQQISIINKYSEERIIYHQLLGKDYKYLEEIKGAKTYKDIHIKMFFIKAKKEILRVCLLINKLSSIAIPLCIVVYLLLFVNQVVLSNPLNFSSNFAPLIRSTAALIIFTCVAASILVALLRLLLRSIEKRLWRAEEKKD